VHRGRAVCSTVGEAVFGRLASVAERTDHLHLARAFRTVSGVHDRATSKIDKTSEPIPEPWMPRNPRESDSPVRTRGIPFLTA
jgi:hypothetical protein